MIPTRYRPKRLLKKRPAPGGTGRSRRWTALLLCVCMLLSLIPAAALAIGEYTVSFVNYDLSQFPDGTGYAYSGVPEGARLYTAEELEKEGVEFSKQENSTWYLCYPGSGTDTYGPCAIPDPPERDGYSFRDWVAQGATGDNIYTVTGDTVFVARYISNSQYVVNLYYQFANESNTVAAETSTVPYGYGETISIPLPESTSLEGLSPQIESSDLLTGMLKEKVFSGPLDDTFLNACRQAGFVAWDEGEGAYQRDENGNVQINIPVTYTLVGEVTFKVEYLGQDPDNPEQYTTFLGSHTGSVDGTTRVSLNEMGLVKPYDGFTLTAASAENADSYNINADGSSVIQLRYDRNVHYIYYQMNGGNAVDPVQLRFGQTIPETVGSSHTRPGYDFDGWTWLDGDGNPLTEEPTTMPDYDLRLEAGWKGTNTTVTLVYWLENANDDEYTVAGQREITVTSGQTVGYVAEDGSQSTVNVSINRYLEPAAMREAGITDGEYFTFAFADSSSRIPAGEDGCPKTAAGDGSTVINIGYTRKEYTLVFHLGRVMNNSYQISTGGNCSTWNRADQWQDGYSWHTVNESPTMTMGGKKYTISNDGSDCYQITAKYGAFISEQWPVATDDNVTETGGYLLFTWGTHAESQYYKNHTENRNIIGIYATMSKELIIDAKDTTVVHHLVAYWNTDKKANKNHHYMFEAVPGTEDEGVAVPFTQYQNYTGVNAQGYQGKPAVQGLSFYEHESSTTVRTSALAKNQNAPAFANLTYQYGCYNGEDVYFFYTYDDYTVTYHENNANLAVDPPVPAGEEVVDFHYIGGKTLKDELVDVNFDYDYEPYPPYFSAYGNAYHFGGWYTDANLTFPVDWDKENPVSSVNFYAKWVAPAFTLTLVVPEGTLYQESLDQFEAKGYDCKVETEIGPDGEETTIYTVSGIPGGTKASEIIEERHGAKSDYSLAFDYWGYQVNGAEQRYLFDESQLVVSDLILTARWKTEYTGRYTVRYLTTEVQENGLEPVEIGNTTYYRLLDDKIVTDVAVGSSVTEEAQTVSQFLSDVGQLTRVVENDMVYFDFIYSRVSDSVTYYVHYVRDVDVDYRRTAPPADAVFLAPSKTVTMDTASLNQSTSVSEAAVVVGGYTPRDSWNTTFTLSALEGENHLYIYYVSNTLLEPFQVVYHFQGEDGKYPTEGENASFTLEAEEALGKVLSADDLAVNYGRYLENTEPLDALMVGRELDTELSEPLLLVTQQEEQNVIHIYMKNGDYTLTYYLNGSEEFPASWPEAEGFLTQSADGGSYTQTVTYPGAATAPTTEPERLAYEFTGWNTAADGSGTSNTTDAPWYQPGGLREDVSLYAQWEERLVVSFDLRDGTWTDTSGPFYSAGGQWVAYVADGGTVPIPSDPSYVLLDGTAYSFVGWTAVDPDHWVDLVGEDKRVDLVEFQTNYSFDFDKPITESTVLYAVWDPDVTTVDIRKTDTGETPLSGAEFTLERLQATVTGSPQGGYDYELVTDGAGDYIRDETFPVRQITSDAAGAGAFENLPAGYYRLKETRAPEGYQDLPQPVILFAPYDGTPEIYKPVPYVSGAVQGGDLLVTVQNISQYSVAIEAPSSLTLTYTPPDWIWNPETLAYEGVGGASGRWQVSAPEGEPETVTVTNRSPGASVQVEVSLQYDEGFRGLLSLTGLTGPEGFTESAGETAKTLSGTLASEAEARFTLEAAGTAPPDMALPAQAERAGTITVQVRKANG